MFYIYILYSHKDEKLYIGCTHNVEKRLMRHQLGHVTSTRFRRPLTPIHTEEYGNKTDAFQRERFLKSLWSSREKKKILKRFLDDNLG
jgi:putative endonuclease